MVRVRFTSNLARHIDAPDVEVDAATVRDALEGVFAHHPMLRGYVLDDQGAVRKHVAVFVGGDQVEDRNGLGDPVRDGDEVFVMQALSGG